MIILVCFYFVSAFGKVIVARFDVRKRVASKMINDFLNNSISSVKSNQRLKEIDSCRFMMKPVLSRQNHIMEQGGNKSLFVSFFVFNSANSIKFISSDKSSEYRGERIVEVLSRWTWKRFSKKNS